MQEEQKKENNKQNTDTSSRLYEVWEDIDWHDLGEEYIDCHRVDTLPEYAGREISTKIHATQIADDYIKKELEIKDRNPHLPRPYAQKIYIIQRGENIEDCVKEPNFESYLYYNFFKQQEHIYTNIIIPVRTCVIHTS